MSEAVLFGIPNCDTVKKARRWLEEHDVAYQFHDFRGDGIAANQIQPWLDRLGWEQVVNKRSTSWRQLTPDQRAALQGPEAAALLAAHPTLIKRPVLLRDGEPTLGFTPALYERLFEPA